MIQILCLEIKQTVIVNDLVGKRTTLRRCQCEVISVRAWGFSTVIHATQWD